MPWRRESAEALPPGRRLRDQDRLLLCAPSTPTPGDKHRIKFDKGLRTALPDFLPPSEIQIFKGL